MGLHAIGRLQAHRSAIVAVLLPLSSCMRIRFVKLATFGSFCLTTHNHIITRFDFTTSFRTLQRIRATHPHSLCLCLDIMVYGPHQLPILNASSFNPSIQPCIHSRILALRALYPEMPKYLIVWVAFDLSLRSPQLC